MIGGRALNANTNPDGPFTFESEPNTKSAPLSDALMSALMPPPTQPKTVCTWGE